MGQAGHALLQRIAGAAGIPSGVHLQVADRCNHACQHCYQVQGRKGELSLDELKALLDDLAASGVMLLNVSGGEATLRPDLLDILRYARSKGFAIRLFTNGYTMTPELASELRVIGLLGVDVSIYSDDAAQHDEVTRVPGSHARTLAGVRAMLDAGLRVHLKVPTTAASLDAGPRVKRLAAELGHGVSVVTTFDITPMETGDMASRQMLAAPEALVEAGVMPPWQPGDDPSPEESLAHPTCGACRDGVAVLSNGDLRPCTDIVAPVGNLREERFLDLYARPGPQLVRSLTWAHVHGCRDCDLRGGCERCHAHAANESGDLLGPYASGCRATLARYRGAVGDLTFLPPDEGCEPGRAATMGPFRVVEPGVLRPIADVLTEEDRQRRAEFPWVRPSREDLERLSYGQQPAPAGRRRLPLLPRASTPLTTVSEAALQLECSVRRFLEEGRSVTLIALGGSMYPSIVAGTQLALSPDPERRPAPGDVVAVARPDGGIAIHRVVVVRPDGRVLTWGDALPRPDDWGFSPVLAWARVLWAPWRPAALRRWVGALRVRSHMLTGRLRAPREAP